MSCSIEEIITPYVDYASSVERIASRKTKLNLTIVAPDPAWPQQFQSLQTRISDALGPTALCISHVGSTSVPGLPAKAVIDIDLTVQDPAAEDEYVPALEAAGFQFLLREPKWHGHRFFAMSEPYYCNLHVFKLGTAELVRHLILRDWLREHEDDRELYTRTKLEAARMSTELGETVMQYTNRKDETIYGILEKAFRAKGYLPQAA